MFRAYENDRAHDQSPESKIGAGMRDSRDQALVQMPIDQFLGSADAPQFQTHYPDKACPFGSCNLNS